MTTTDPWTSTDHDPTSNSEHGPANTLVVRAANGAELARFPDFAPGTPLRVLPAIVSSIMPAEQSVIDDNWAFSGATRHPEYATIRHTRDNVTMAMERHRLQHRIA